jgi:hypothetical protein
VLATAVTLCVACLAVAGYAVYTQLKTGRHDRALIIELTCASVLVREDFDARDASEWRARVDDILARYDEAGRCGGP